MTQSRHSARRSIHFDEVPARDDQPDARHRHQTPAPGDRRQNMSLAHLFHGTAAGERSARWDPGTLSIAAASGFDVVPEAHQVGPELPEIEGPEHHDGRQCPSLCSIRRPIENGSRPRYMLSRRMRSRGNTKILSGGSMVALGHRSFSASLLPESLAILVPVQRGADFAPSYIKRGEGRLQQKPSSG
jgi:hypothetical protein